MLSYGLHWREKLRVAPAIELTNEQASELTRLARSGRTSVFDIWIMIIFGVVSYIFNKLKFSMASIILPLILGPMMEQNLQQSLILSKGSWAIFFTSPIPLDC